MNSQISVVLKAGRVVSAITGIIILAACGTYQSKEPPPLMLTDVDFVTNGVVKLVGQFSNADLNKDPRILCEKRAPTGSNITKTFCITLQERKDLKMADQRTLATFIDEYERMYFRHQSIQKN